jgi:hypothetical protein
LRRATVAAGFVAHYKNTCRRCKSRERRPIQGAPREWSWKFADTEQRTCPTCRVKLWITARVYDQSALEDDRQAIERVDLCAARSAAGATDARPPW